MLSFKLSVKYKYTHANYIMQGFGCYKSLTIYTLAFLCPHTGEQKMCSLTLQIYSALKPKVRTLKAGVL